MYKYINMAAPVTKTKKQQKRTTSTSCADTILSSNDIIYLKVTKI